jgi:DNA-directed RNA polymerase I, II, and III subunit RPABC2
MPRLNTKTTSAKRSKSVDSKPSNDYKKSPLKKVTNKPKKDIEPEYDTDEEVEDLEFDADDEEFFDEKNFKDFNTRIQFRVFDPEKYVNEAHKEIIVVPNQYRKTSEVITKFEYTDVTSNRAKQIENGSPIFTDIKDESDPIKMAEMEIRMKRCPLSVRRLISSNICEIWDVNDMVVPY